jgi:hypothetical protein
MNCLSAHASHPANSRAGTTGSQEDAKAIDSDARRSSRRTGPKWRNWKVKNTEGRNGKKDELKKKSFKFSKLFPISRVLFAPEILRPTG